MKTVLITGATGAIGKATAMELAKQNCNLILLGRNTEKLRVVKADISQATHNHNIEFIHADLSEPKHVREACDEIKKKYSSLNALINIAAVFNSKREETTEGREFMVATNHLGPFLLTNELIDLLKAGKPARIVTVSAPSTTKVNFDDIDSKQRFSPGFMGVFGATKMMNILFTYALADRLRDTGITANVFHPGLVKSDLTSDMPLILNLLIGMMSGKPDKAAKMLASLALDEKWQNSNGAFIKFDGKDVKSSAYSHDKEVQEKLWKLSEELTK